MDAVTLYGAANSLYSGRARSYLIKAAIDYREIGFNTPHFMEEVRPKAGGRQGLPTLETADGTVIRDGAAIIDYFEAKNGGQFSPATPKQRVISRLFDVIGAEGLLRPAMHYRWGFEENLPLLTFHFRSLMPKGAEHMAEKAMDRMRQATLQFGATPDKSELVESLYESLLDKLNDHFALTPYLLGGKPCIGDFGLIAPMYGHLGRDPKPLSMMQTRAIHVFRWVERMNRPELDVGEFANSVDTYLPDDEIPDTLIEILKHIAIDFLPETRAAAETINHWLDANPVEPGATAERAVGLAEFEVQGTTVQAIAQPYRFYLLARVQKAYDELSEADQLLVKELLQAADLQELLGIRLSRDIGRANNLEVWL